MSKNNSFNDDIVVTGLGVVSPLGSELGVFWDNLLKGTSGISKITLFNTDAYERKYAGEIPDFDVENADELQNMGRASQMTIVASRLALQDAGIDLKSLSDINIALGVGTTMGEVRVLEKTQEQYSNLDHFYAENDQIIKYPYNKITDNLSKALNIQGPRMVFSNACSSGNHAIAWGMELLKSGRIDCALLGGIDTISRIAFTGFSRLLAMASEKCCPFDKNRKGMLLGEGSGMLFLEREKDAKARGAKIYARVLGYGLSCDAHHMTTPNSRGVVKAISKALNDSDISINDVDYICAHGTGTKENDKAESRAIKEVFGSETENIPVSSIKSMLGHTMGAASAIESIACCLTIKNGEIPPTINFEELDPECEPVYCVANKSLEKSVNIIVNNSQAFGGNNAVVCFGK